MARTKAISLIQNGATKVELAELSGLVIQNIQKDTLASGLKSQSYADVEEVPPFSIQHVPDP